MELNLKGKTIERFEIMKETVVVARNYPTETKPFAIRFHFTDGTHTEIEVDSRGNYGEFTHFLKIT